ncbi:Uncharacterised protein [Halioglobus japonicus]|nr:Uncharacterised protein [Halioglobus japonicus]
MQNRRSFLKSSLALPMTMSGGSILGSLAGFNAQAADTSGYRALVCVFLFGGMDCHDTVLPYDTASYNDYADIRAPLLDTYAALPGGSTRTRESLLALTPLNNTFGARQFALPPQMSAMHTLFTQGRAAIVGNVGPLTEPTDRAGFYNNSAQLPARLFSHNDQQSTWMSFAPEGSQLGWGGRFGDATMTGNLQSVFSQISLAGNSVFLTGERVSPFQISADGVPAIRLIEAAPAQLGSLLRDHFDSTGANRSNLFERDVINLSRVSLAANDTLGNALLSSTAINTPFPTSGLGAQLRAVAQTIAVRDTLGASRQVFFVSIGGFDTHSTQAADLPGLQQDISDSISAFYSATEELGVANEVTTFTAADFGRTLTVNGDGTDHGWGSHHFVVGGAVKGGEIYGDIPVSQLEHSQDAGNGRLIPSLSVEQFAAPMGSWFGLNQQELNTALPGLANFTAGGLNLFV